MKNQTENTAFAEVKKSLGMKDADVAQAFGYKTRAAYYNSSARPRIEEGIVKMYKIITDAVKEKLNSF